MGRLVISPHFRGGPESLKGFLYLSLSFLHGLSPVGSLHATCTPVLARLYRRFGFSVVAKDVPLLGTAKTYTVIHGYFNEVIAELAEHDSAHAPLAAAHLPAHLPALLPARAAANNNRGAFA